MPHRIDSASLVRWCSESADHRAAVAVAERLGWLAPWWMSPRALKHAAQLQPAYRAYLNRPLLSAQPGSCWPICVLPSHCGQGLLRPAFVLPCQWVRDADYDPYLPSSLRRLADWIIGQLGKDAPGRWSLILNAPQGADKVDLSGLDENAFEPSSAWASLATGLILAAKALCPRTDVWASAAWNDQIGIESISGISQKLDLAAEWNAKTVFLPAQNHVQAEEWKANSKHPLQIEYLAPVGSNPQARTVLERYLVHLLVEPEADDPYEKCVTYYQAVPRINAEKFYQKALLPHAVKRNREYFVRKNIKPTHLVTALGNQINHAFMTAAALDVQHCFAIYKEQGMQRAALDDFVNLCRAQGIRVDLFAVPGETLAEEKEHIRNRLQQFTPQYERDASRLAFDLTPGFKSLSLALYEIAPRGSHLLYCRHEQLQDQRVNPGTEKYEAWTKN